MGLVQLGDARIPQRDMVIHQIKIFQLCQLFDWQRAKDTRSYKIRHPKIIQDYFKDCDSYPGIFYDFPNCYHLGLPSECLFVAQLMTHLNFIRTSQDFGGN